MVGSTRQKVWAEAPPETMRKPIYDDDPVTNPAPARTRLLRSSSSSSSSSPASPSSTQSLTPTDRVTEQVRRTRQFLYTRALVAENGVNDVLSRVLRVENACADAVASLAPPPESGEQLLPASIYVVVSAMAGAIGSRNRGILLRTAMPLAFGALTARMLLPVTMQNVANRGWEWEQKNAPSLAERHLRLRRSWDHTWSTGVAHSHMARFMMEEKIRHGRETLEKWVREG